MKQNQNENCCKINVVFGQKRNMLNKNEMKWGIHCSNKHSKNSNNHCLHKKFKNNIK